MTTIVIYDDIEQSAVGEIWKLGAKWYRFTGQADYVFGATSVKEGLQFALGVADSGQKIDQVEWWNHGQPGASITGTDALSNKSLEQTEMKHMLEDLGAAMSGTYTELDGVFWLRACSCFAGPKGHQFAEHLADRVGVPVAGHTHIIGTWGMHSGLHTVGPSEPPSWALDEGKIKGKHGKAESHPWAVNTISALRNSVPEGW